MKLKNLLFLAFLVLTLIPIIIVSILLYQSGFSLSKESYISNLIESINVEVDYISQTIENTMISDYRFANKNKEMYLVENDSSGTKKKELISLFQSYLEISEDKISVCMLLDKNDKPIYSVGEKSMLDKISGQLPNISALSSQIIMEFELGEESHSLGIITPIYNTDKSYVGSLVSIFDKSYIFKIISSYYRISETSTYICSANSNIISFREYSNQKEYPYFNQALLELTFENESIIDMKIHNKSVSGYYKNIHNSPWYLVGFVDHDLIYAFANQFISIYIFIIIGVFIADLILSFYFSKKVVEPINNLIKVMEGYQNSWKSADLEFDEKSNYFEIQYLRTKFFSLMKTIMLIQHNFEGVYQLYQSNDMDDTNIDIDVKAQVIHSNKKSFEELMQNLSVPKGACIVERFTRCFCDKDQSLLMNMFENMRDEHLSTNREVEVYTPHLNERWFHVLVVPVYEDERLLRLFVQLRDISGFKKQEFESFEQARRDSLTRLYNRSGFMESVHKILALDNAQCIHGLLFIDMNYFKMVNDNLGHSAGDYLLCSVGNTLLSTISSNDIVARLGGDEFVVFLSHTSQEKILQMRDTLSDKLIFPFTAEKISFVVSASIGISLWQYPSSETLETKLKQADTDMYNAKREFKNDSN